MAIQKTRKFKRPRPSHARSPKDNEANTAPAKRLKSAKNRLTEEIGVILQNPEEPGFSLIDSGEGRKLEQYGPYLIDRPESQAIWQRSKGHDIWNQIDARFTGDREEEGMGRWHFPKNPLQETWPMHWHEIQYLGRFTSFRHVGVFPEQSAHWCFMRDKIRAGNRKISLLNLFGYTGLASLVAAKAGAQVTHVDASKKAISWAKENQMAANLESCPIRWICDDATKFCQREVRRGNHYDAIILDPPKFGRGPKGEVWDLFDSLPHMLDLCRQLISERPVFVILTAYSIRASFMVMHEIMQEVFGDCGGTLQSGELVIKTRDSDRSLSTSMFSRWIA